MVKAKGGSTGTEGWCYVVAWCTCCRQELEKTDEELERVAQRGSGGPIPRNIQRQVGQVLRLM